MPAVVTLDVHEGEGVTVLPVTPDHERDQSREGDGSGRPVAQAARRLSDQRQRHCDPGRPRRGCRRARKRGCPQPL